MQANANQSLISAARTRAVVIPVLWALMASAMVIESDAYRYVAIGFVIFVFIRHGADVRRLSKDWLACLCYAWSAYVVLRFAAGIVVHGEKGSSEWLYAFPALFPLVGVALYATRRHLFTAATLLLVGGAIGLLATLDFQTIASGERTEPLFHNNPIHAGVGCAMLFLSSLFWLLYAGENGYLKTPRKWAYLALGGITAALSLTGVLGAQSKGGGLALAATSATSRSPYVLKVAGTTMDASATLTQGTLASANPMSAMRVVIDDPHAPEPWGNGSCSGRTPWNSCRNPR